MGKDTDKKENVDVNEELALDAKANGEEWLVELPEEQQPQQPKPQPQQSQPISKKDEQAKATPLRDKNGNVIPSPEVPVLGEDEMHAEIDAELAAEAAAETAALDKELDAETAALNKKLDAEIKLAKKSVERAVDKSEISEIYNPTISELSSNIKKWEEARDTAKENDEVAKKRASSMKMIAGISDGLASLANLIGVAKGGTNIDMGTGALTPLQQSLEKARLERKADIKDISDRLSQYQNQLNQMRMQKNAALYNYDKQQEANEVAAAAKAAEYAFKASEGAANRASNEAIAAGKIATTVSEGEKNRDNKLEVAEINAQGKSRAAYKRDYGEVMFYGADNKQTTYVVPKSTLAVINANAQTFVDKDLKDETNTALAQAYKEYQTAVATNNTITASDDVKRAWAKVLNASPTYRAEIEKHGTQKGKTTSWMDAYPDPEE